MSVIIKDLPLLDGTLVHRNLTLADALGSNHLLNPVLILHNKLAHTPVIGDTRVILIVATDKESHLIVFFIQVPVGVRVITSQQAHVFGISLLFGPDFLKTLLRVEGTLLGKLEIAQVRLHLQGHDAFVLATARVKSGH